MTSSLRFLSSRCGYQGTSYHRCFLYIHPIPPHHPIIPPPPTHVFASISSPHSPAPLTAHQSTLTHRLQLTLDAHRARIAELEDLLERKGKDRMDLSTDMGRQYKAMQSEMCAKVAGLEGVVEELGARLGE